MKNRVLNARPTPEFEGGSTVFCHSFLRQNEIDIIQEKEHTAELVEYFQLAEVDVSSRLEVYCGENVDLRKEIHHEFVLYIWIISAKGDLEHIRNVPEHWLNSFPGKLLTQILITFNTCTPTSTFKEKLHTVFGENQLIGNMVEQDSARIWTDYYGDKQHKLFRVYIEDFSLGPKRRGRLSQNIIELENYRSVAEIAFPIAEEIVFELETKEIDLSLIVKDISEVSDTMSQQKLLHQLLDLSVISENWRSNTGHRFSATSAYKKLIEDRLQHLDETKVLGYQSFSNFLNRNTMPTFRTCEAANNRLNVFITRIDRAISLLSTRIRSTTEQQNNELLASVNDQNKQQIVLQETIEAFAVVAISYNSCALIHMFLKSLTEQGVNINIPLFMSITIPSSIAVSFLLIDFLKKRKLSKK
ncbi:DUF3422 family protein [Colwellia sp. RE-S-Sl-9]